MKHWLSHYLAVILKNNVILIQHVNLVLLFVQQSDYSAVWLFSRLIIQLGQQLQPSTYNGSFNHHYV